MDSGIKGAIRLACGMRELLHRPHNRELPRLGVDDTTFLLR
jgi:hypothetical protein